jgi:hypothetical protein
MNGESMLERMPWLLLYRVWARSHTKKEVLMTKEVESLREGV